MPGDTTNYYEDPKFEYFLNILRPKAKDQTNSTSVEYTPAVPHFTSAARLLEGASIDETSAGQKHLKDTLYYWNSDIQKLIIIYPPRFASHHPSTLEGQKCTNYINQRIKHHWAFVSSNTSLYNTNPLEEQSIALFPAVALSGIRGLWLDKDDRPLLCEGDNHATIAARTVRVAQYLQNLKVMPKDLYQACRDAYQNSPTANRIGALKSKECFTSDNINYILQGDYKWKDKEGIPEAYHAAIRRELIGFQRIYELRVKHHQKYLGIFGLFGTHTAQEKLNAVTKFLEDPNKPLDKAAQQGELGKLISLAKASM